MYVIESCTLHHIFRQIWLPVKMSSDVGKPSVGTSKDPEPSHHSVMCKIRHQKVNCGHETSYHGNNCDTSQWTAWYCVQGYVYPELTPQVALFGDKSWGAGPQNKATRNITRALEWPVETEATFSGLHPAFRCGRGAGISTHVTMMVKIFRMCWQHFT